MRNFVEARRPRHGFRCIQDHGQVAPFDFYILVTTLTALYSVVIFLISLEKMPFFGVSRINITPSTRFEPVRLPAVWPGNSIKEITSGQAHYRFPAEMQDLPSVCSNSVTIDWTKALISKRA